MRASRIHSILPRFGLVVVPLVILIAVVADDRPVVWDLVLRSPNRYAWHRTGLDVGELHARHPTVCERPV